MYFTKRLHLKIGINWKYIYAGMNCFCTGYAESTLMPSECVNGYFCASEVVPCSHDGTTLLGTSRHSLSQKNPPGTDSSLTPSLTHPCMDGRNVRKEGKKGWGATYANRHHSISIICCYGRLMLASCSCGLIKRTVKV